MSYLAGAGAGILLFDYLTSHGQTLTITDNITTNMTINSTTVSQTECFQSSVGNQSIVVNEAPLPNATLEGQISDSCNYCISQINTIQKARVAVEDAAQAANPGYKAQVPNPDLQLQMTTGGSSGAPTPGVSVTQQSLGPCNLLCADLVVVGVAQSISLKATANCQVTNTFSTDIDQSIQGQISASLKNQQDFIGQLESAFTSNNESLAVNLANNMSQNITKFFQQSLSQTMSANQFVGVQGNSVYAAGIDQTFTGSMVGQLTVSNTVNDQLRQSASYSIAQSLLNKNDTIGDLAGDFLQVIQTMSALIEELTTQILILIAAVLGAVILVIGSLYIFNKSFHQWTNTGLKNRVENATGKTK